ncbi:hypothetical protein FQN51_000302 [Onygenales sp. PD_10]|nr:hypothetical protein FQN51_000302 [Onygenales sp. PD_10]
MARLRFMPSITTIQDLENMPRDEDYKLKFDVDPPSKAPPDEYFKFPMCISVEYTGAKSKRVSKVDFHFEVFELFNRRDNSETSQLCKAIEKNDVYEAKTHQDMPLKTDNESFPLNFGMFRKIGRYRIAVIMSTPEWRRPQVRAYAISKDITVEVGCTSISYFTSKYRSYVR